MQTTMSASEMGAIDARDAFWSQNVSRTVIDGVADEGQRTQVLPVMLGRERDQAEAAKVDRDVAKLFQAIA